MESAPPFLFKKSMNEELYNHWVGEYVHFKETKVPKDANVVDSNFFYKIKVEEGRKKRLKARLSPYGNRDRMKGNIRNYSATVRFEIIRLLLPTATLYNFSLGCVYIRGSHL